jgi:predicted metal-dependent enzyme (double-stranded beta helix superfamily)
LLYGYRDAIEKGSFMSADTRTSLALDTNELQQLSELPVELALRQAASFLAHLVKDPAFLEAEILPLLGEVRGKEGWYVARRYEDKDLSFSLQIFVWPPGTRTRIHDHSSWGVYCCAVGSVLEERYERLDDGSRPDHARLKKIWQLLWSREDGASSVLPHDGGIHRVGNPSDSLAISVHLYGPRIGEVDGRDYDLSRNYVCDRRED